MGAKQNALLAAAKQFRSYENSHYAKGTEEGNQKGLTNGLLAEQMERAAAMQADFGIGSDVWPGLSKLTEEMGETHQLLGKLIGTGGSVHHWDGQDIGKRLCEELGDVLGSIDFFTELNPELLVHVIQNRRNAKLKQFREWHKNVPPLPIPGEPKEDPGYYILHVLQDPGGAYKATAVWSDGYENSIDLRNYPSEDQDTIKRRLESLRARGQA